MTKNLYEALREKARTHGDKTLFLHEDRTVTFGQTLEKVDALAAAFKKRGVEKGSTFAISLRNCPEFVFAYLALSRLGAAAVPINFLVTKPAELEYLLTNSGAAGVLTQKEFLKNYERIRSKVPQARIWVGLDVRPEGGETLQDLIEERKGDVVWRWHPEERKKIDAERRARVDKKLAEKAERYRTMREEKDKKEAGEEEKEEKDE